jgi:hypothetical protein
MPNNILYALGFFLTIGKRSGKRQNRTCTDKLAKQREKLNKTGHSDARQPTDQWRFRHLAQVPVSVKFGGGGGKEIVDNFSGDGDSKAVSSPLGGLWRPFDDAEMT